MRQIRPRLVFVGTFLMAWLSWPEAHGLVDFTALSITAAGVTTLAEVAMSFIR